METREIWREYWLILLLVNQVGSDWLNCAGIIGCRCKWSSGKKTALCTSNGMKIIPRLSSEIQVLDLSENPLRTLEKDAFARIDLVNLQRLNLSSTNLRSIHLNTFRDLRILIELDLSQNQLQHLSPETFKANERLRLLILNDNPLSTLVAEQFPPLQHLRRIELSRCRLQIIHPFAFINLRALETVHLNQNLLSYLHQDTFNLPVLKTLLLAENPWYCDCKLRDFLEWFLMAKLGNEYVTCSGPDKLKKSPWHIIKGTDMVCPPSAISSPAVIRTEIGADIKFGCFVRGDPKPNVTWIFRDTELYNDTYWYSNIYINRYQLDYYDEYRDDFINKSALWVNVTINNMTRDLSGDWKCLAKSHVGDAIAYISIVLPKARAASARVPPNYSTLFMVIGSMFAMTAAGFIATCVCWKTRRRRVPPSRSFTDQEKKLLDTSIAVSYDRTSGDLGSSYAFEMLDRSISLESEDTQRCLDPVQITVEGPHGPFPPPPAEFALPAPYGNIFISVQVAGHNVGYPDLLGGGSTLPRRSRTCFLQSDYFDNMGPRITAAGSSTWSLPGANIAGDKIEHDVQSSIPFNNFSTEFTAL